MYQPSYWGFLLRHWCGIWPSSVYLSSYIDKFTLFLWYVFVSSTLLYAQAPGQLQPDIYPPYVPLHSHCASASLILCVQSDVWRTVPSMFQWRALPTTRVQCCWLANGCPQPSISEGVPGRIKVEYTVSFPMESHPVSHSSTWIESGQDHTI